MSTIEFENRSDQFKVFVSYSRRDIVVADALVKDLEQNDYRVLIDHRNLPYGEQWKEELVSFIQDSDTIIWLVSPNSIDSDWCNWELGLVERLKKRLIPIRIRDIDFSRLPKSISDIHLLPGEGIYTSQAHLSALVETLNTDQGWLKEATRIANHARQWLSKDRDRGSLLRGGALTDAEAWKNRQPTKAPTPASETVELILASRQAATQRQRYWLGGSIIAALLAITLAGVALVQGREAIRQRNEVTQTLGESDLEQASQLLLRNEPVAKPLALLARSYRNAGNNLALMKLWQLLQAQSFWVPAGTATATATGVRSAEAQSPLKTPSADFLASILHNTGMEVDYSAMSSDGKLLFTSISDGTGGPRKILWRLWDENDKPLTDWITPEYNGETWLYSVRGFPSPDSNFVAVELMGWREPAFVEVYDVVHRKFLSGKITAQGLDPETQNAKFGVIKFVPCPQGDTKCTGPLLLLGSERGQAVAMRIDGDNVYDATDKHNYDNPVVVVEVDRHRDWFMSGSSHGTVTVSGLNPENAGEQVFPEPLNLHRTPAELERNGNDLVLRFNDGVSTTFRLLPPIRLSDTPVSKHWNKEQTCITRDGWKSPSPLVDRPVPQQRIIVQTFDPRRLQLEISGQKGEEQEVSRDFNADIIFVCANTIADSVIVGLQGFVSQVWRSDLSEQIGQDLNELALVHSSRRPTKFEGAYLSPDGRILAAKTSFWDPPNLYLAWFSLWDVGMGIPLGDRIEFADDGFSSKNSIDENDVAFFSIDGRDIGFTSGCPGKCVVNNQKQLQPPTEIGRNLPDIAEAIAGVRYDPQGVLQYLPDEQRIKILSLLNFR